MNESKHEAVVILHNIRSAQNVGAIFRTADAIGVAKVYLTGYTPQPLDRFGRPDSKVAKTALGAELHIPWEYHKNLPALCMQLKQEGYAVVGVEQDKRAVDYKSYVPTGKTALLMGNEVLGISPALRRRCDALIEIPMRGKKESLNVSVAFGIAIYRLVDR
jgi:tRNA G18 (ribose-2'-O)-methylase SpoU